MFLLGFGKTSLQFQIVRFALGEQFSLPVITAGALAPDKEFPTLQTACGEVDKAGAVRADQGFIFPGIFRDIIEVIPDRDEVFRIGAVKSFTMRQIDVDDEVIAVFVNVGIGVCGRDNHPGAGRHGHCNIAPPVHGGDFRIGVGEPYPGIEKSGSRRQKEVHLIRRLAVAAVIVDPEDRTVFRIMQFSGKPGRAGVGIVTAAAAVPLGTARKPCVADGKVAGEKFLIVRQKFHLAVFIIEPPQSAAHGEGEFSDQVFIFQHCRRKFHRLYRRKIIFILHGIGQRVKKHPVIDKKPIRIRQFGSDRGGDGITQSGESAFRTYRDAVDLFGEKSQFSHYETPFFTEIFSCTIKPSGDEYNPGTEFFILL